MNPDFVGLLRALSAAEVRFLVVGAYAVTFHTRPRATGDLDLWLDPTPENARRAWRALRGFGASMDALAEQDLATPQLAFQLGVEPRRIDLLTSLTGLEFDAAWARRVPGTVGQVPCQYLSREDLLVNKRALGRPRDLAGVEMLEGDR